MTDAELIAKIEEHANVAALDGGIMGHCWLEAPARALERSVGDWFARVTVRDLFELLELAKRGAQ